MARKHGQLTDKQARFIREYLIDLNATQAAIRAGYSQKTAEEIGYENLRKPQIADAIQKAQDKQAEKLEISAERVLKEYARIAFADIRSVAEVQKLFDCSEDEAAHVLKQITIKTSDEWDDDTAAAVAEISATQHGPRVKMHDKQHALDALSKHLGLFKADNEQSKLEIHVECPTPDLESLAAALRAETEGKP